VLVVALEFSMKPATKSSTRNCAYFFPRVVDAKFCAEQLLSTECGVVEREAGSRPLGA